MFKEATSFNQDMNNWEVSNVKDMREMFQNAKSFNSDISKWNVSNVLYMSNMFNGAVNFNVYLPAWNDGRFVRYSLQGEWGSPLAFWLL